MTAEHFMIGDRVRSIDGRDDGIVEARDPYGWPIVRIGYARFSTGVEPVRIYEAPGHWRVVR